MISIFPTILVTPKKGWEAVKNLAPTKKEVLLRYAMPLLAIAGISAIIGEYIEAGDLTWKIGFNRLITMVIPLFMGIYISAFLLKGTYKLLFDKTYQFADMLIFTIFSYSCIIAVLILNELFEETFFFLGIFYLYTVYIVYEGSNVILGIETKSEKKLQFVAIASSIILACPWLIGLFMRFAMPGLK